MIVVTGGAGFIGSNLVHELARRGAGELVVVDEPLDPPRFANLVGAPVADFLDPDELLRMLGSRAPRVAGVDAVLHHGAVTSTTDPDGGRVLDRNHEYTRALIDACAGAGVPLVYASSASVYGDITSCTGHERPLRPLNIYAFSKALTDRYVLRCVAGGHPTPLIGLRYHNVYGPREAHKGPMRSIVAQLDDQLATSGRCRIFGASHGLGPGEQSRDFVHVDDVVAVALWAVDHLPSSGIYDCGTGVGTSFNDVAALVARHHPGGLVEHIEFPAELLGSYQADTRASLEGLRAAGCDHRFHDVAHGVDSYLAWRRATGEVAQRGTRRADRR